MRGQIYQDALRRHLYSYIAQGRSPGVAAAYGNARTGEHFMHCMGRIGDGLPPTDEQSFYDLASLTKVLCTTLIAAQAVAEGRLSLDERPWPNWPDVCVRHVLQHRSGLADWQPFYEEAMRSFPFDARRRYTQIVESVRHTSLVAKPDTTTCYSDLGFIVLGDLLTQRFNCSLDDLFRALADVFYGQNTLHYSPVEKPLADDKWRYVPTEECPWRKMRLWGRVDDDNAYAMGGVAGHAGLFGTLSDVQKACRRFIEALTTPHPSALEQVLQHFASEQGRFAIGFERPDLDGTGSTAWVLKDAALGHLGFVGSSMWFCHQGPYVGEYYVLLSNPIFHGRKRPGLMDYRRGFHLWASRFLRAT